MSRALAFVVLALVACKSGKSAKKDAAVAAAGDGGVDPSAVAAQLDKKCLAQDFEACRNLGVMYAEGLGVPADPKRATALFAQACNGKNLSACNALALSLAEGMGVERNPERAAEVYQQACDGGHMMACRNLGLMLRDGRGLNADLERAAGLLDKACKGRVPFACTNAGDLEVMRASEGGSAASGHYKRAIAYFKEGCEAGDPTGCRQIGIAYIEGKGLPKSTTAAAVWFERACVADDPIGCRVLGAMLVDGVGVSRDLERGRQLLARACDRKDDEACRLAKIAGGPTGDAGVPGSQPPSGEPSPPSDSGSVDAASKTR